jgi:hypothetical protein
VSPRGPGARVEGASDVAARHEQGPVQPARRRWTEGGPFRRGPPPVVSRGSLLGKRLRRQVGPGPESRARAMSLNAANRALCNPHEGDLQKGGHPGEGRHPWS